MDEKDRTPHAATQFFCMRHKCHMSYTACVRRQKLVQAGGKLHSKNAPASAEAAGISSPEHCIDCPQGREAEKALAGQKAAEIRSPDPHTCIWLDCTETPVASSGLCKQHQARARANTLVQVNTAGASDDALNGLIRDIVTVSNHFGLAPDDVAIACLYKGLRCVMDRYARGKGSHHG